MSLRVEITITTPLVAWFSWTSPEHWIRAVILLWDIQRENSGKPVWKQSFFLQFHLVMLMVQKWHTSDLKKETVKWRGRSERGISPSPSCSIRACSFRHASWIDVFVRKRSCEISALSLWVHECGNKERFCVCEKEDVIAHKTHQLWIFLGRRTFGEPKLVLLVDAQMGEIAMNGL